MLTDSELRTMAQDIQIELVKSDPDSKEIPTTWTGKYIEFANVPSIWPWNGDLLQRSFPETDSVVAFYFDHSVSGAGFGQWYFRHPYMGIIAAEDLVSLLAELGLD